jgi:class 3 adenylate cyclase
MGRSQAPALVDSAEPSRSTTRAWLHGDGINIAARIQQLASPGEVVMTAAGRDYVWNKPSSGSS